MVFDQSERADDAIYINSDKTRVFDQWERAQSPIYFFNNFYKFKRGYEWVFFDVKYDA